MPAQPDTSTLPAPGGVDPGLATDLYRQMARIRATELRLQQYVAEHGFGGFWHPGLGQEGVQAGAVAALRREDYLFYAHRGLGYALAKGMRLEVLLGRPARRAYRAAPAGRVAARFTSSIPTSA